MAKAILGRKVGMTQIFDAEGKAIPVTVIEAGPCKVVQVKTEERDGYAALQIGFGAVRPKLVNKPKAGHFKKAGIEPLRYLREVPADEEAAVGSEITVDIFSEKEYVDVTGISRGKGFAGGIKRWNFGRGPMSHGSKYHRGPGSLGATGPARVFKGRKLPGHYGNTRVTVQNLEVVKVDPEKNLLVIKGSVPGVRGSLLYIKKAVRKGGAQNA
ncbi:MAG: 50S ribosomal protein L3 [Firmicutes bacterium]|nr:50S ribosomal protein L3 [Bacillota bacterium]HQD38926.1 50S ribosomal protein L3 [Bacillota bacterium]